MSLVFLLFCSFAIAQSADDWQDLQQARLWLIEDNNTSKSIDVFNRIIATYSTDDPIYVEALYWKGRALYMSGFKEHAREELSEASSNYKMRSEALYFLQQSGAWQRRVTTLPYQGNSWVNNEGVPSLDPSLAWMTAFDAKASRFREVEVWIDSDIFPVTITVELIDWRNERWIWTGEVRDSSQPLKLQVNQFRSPRGESFYRYRNILISAESLDGRRVPITIIDFNVRE